MTQPAAQRDSTFYRVQRLTRHFARSLVASRGLSGRWEMGRCLWGWTAARLGRARPAQEVHLRLRDFEMTVAPGRLEISPYWELWFEGQYELLPEFQAGEGSCVVDIGANIGFYAIRQALRARRGRVIAFEPAPSVFRRLKANVDANHLNQVTAVNAAIGATAGAVHFVESAWSINCRIVNEPTRDSVQVTCETLDSAMARLGVEAIDILKVDTEGFERAVLQGASATLPRVRRIVLEAHKDVEGERRLIAAMLEPAGFREAARQGSLLYYTRPAEGS